MSAHRLAARRSVIFRTTRRKNARSLSSSLPSTQWKLHHKRKNYIGLLTKTKVLSLQSTKEKDLDLCVIKSLHPDIEIPLYTWMWIFIVAAWDFPVDWFDDATFQDAAKSWRKQLSLSPVTMQNHRNLDFCRTLQGGVICHMQVAPDYLSPKPRNPWILITILTCERLGSTEKCMFCKTPLFTLLKLDRKVPYLLHKNFWLSSCLCYWVFAALIPKHVSLHGTTCCGFH